MAEYIEREAVLEAVCTGCSPQICSLDCDIATAVKAIPAADVRTVVRGKWALFGRRGIYGVMYECSACHAKYDGITNFCPNCGARMEES